MTEWLGSLWRRGPPEKPIEEQIAATSTKAHQVVTGIEEEYAKNEKMIAQYGESVKRLHAGGHKEAAAREFQSMKRLQARQTQIRGKIETVRAVDTNVKDMHANVVISGVVKETNAVSEKIAKTMTVDDVHDQMDTAKAHFEDNNEISNALGGSAFFDPVDQEEVEQDLDAFINAGTASAQPVAQPAVVASQPIPVSQKQQETELLEFISEMPAIPKKPVATSKTKFVRNK